MTLIGQLDIRDQIGQENGASFNCLHPNGLTNSIKQGRWWGKGGGGGGGGLNITYHQPHLCPNFVDGL